MDGRLPSLAGPAPLYDHSVKRPARIIGFYFICICFSSLRAESNTLKWVRTRAQRPADHGRYLRQAEGAFRAVNGKPRVHQEARM